MSARDHLENAGIGLGGSLLVHGARLAEHASTLTEHMSDVGWAAFSALAAASAVGLARAAVRKWGPAWAKVPKSGG